MAAAHLTCASCGWNAVTGRRQCAACDGPTSVGPRPWAVNAARIVLAVAVVVPAFLFQLAFGAASFWTRTTGYLACLCAAAAFGALLTAASSAARCDACPRRVDESRLSSDESSRLFGYRVGFSALGFALLAAAVALAVTFHARLV